MSSLFGFHAFEILALPCVLHSKPRRSNVNSTFITMRKLCKTKKITQHFLYFVLKMAAGTAGDGGKISLKRYPKTCCCCCCLASRDERQQSVEEKKRRSLPINEKALLLIGMLNKTDLEQQSIFFPVKTLSRIYHLRVPQDPWEESFLPKYCYSCDMKLQYR